MSRNFFWVLPRARYNEFNKINILEIQKSWDLQLQKWLKTLADFEKTNLVMLSLPTILQVQSVSTIWIWGTSDPYHVGFHAAIPGVHTQSHGHPKKFVLLPPRRMESCWVCRNVRKSAREGHCIDWGEEGKPENQDNLFLQKAQIKEKVDESECSPGGVTTFTDPQCHLLRTSLPKHHMFSEVSQKITGLNPSFRHWGMILGW